MTWLGPLEERCLLPRAYCGDAQQMMQSRSGRTEGNAIYVLTVQDRPTSTGRRHSMSHLQGRVAIVTGASRGIGRAIALGLAKAGCHVVIAAKSTAPTEKLPGSIHTVAAEVE